MPIRLTDIPGLRSTDLNMPTVSKDDATATGEAFGKVAEGIASVSTAFRKLAPALQEKEETRHTLDFTRMWEDESAKTDAAVAKEQDPEKKLALMNDLHARMRKAVRSPQYSERTRAAVGGWTEQKVENNRIRTTGQVARKVSDGASESLFANINFAIESSNPLMLEDTLERGITARLISPEQEAMARHRYQEKQEYDEISQGIRDDPAKMAETLSGKDARKNYSHTSMEKLDGFRDRARHESHLRSNEFWNKLVTDATQEGGQRRVLSNDELDTLVKQGKLTADHSLIYKQNFRTAEPPKFDPAVYNELHAHVAQYDPSRDTGGALPGLREKVAMAPLPKESARKLNGMLDERLRRENPVVHQLQAEFEKQTDERFQSGHFGGGWNVFAVGNALEEPAYQEAQKKRHEFSEMFGSYLANAPKGLSRLEAQTFYNKLFDTFVLNTTNETLPIPSAPQEISFDERAYKAVGHDYVPPVGPPARPKLAEVEIKEPGMFYQHVKVDAEKGMPLPTNDVKNPFETQEGATLPLELVQRTFPGKDEAWMRKNVHVVVRTQDARSIVLPLARLVPPGESVWEKNKKSSLTLTDDAVRQLYGHVNRDPASPSSPAPVTGLGGSVSFALTTDNAGTEVDAATHTWEEYSAKWWQDKRPKAPDQITSGLAALRQRWTRAQNP